MLLAAALAGTPAEAAGARDPHEFALALGPSSTATYLLFSWTSPKRVGAYVRMFPTLKDDHDAQANSTVTDESAGEVGVSVRVLPWLTVGAGYGRYEKTDTTYGDPDFLFGIPVFLGEDTTIDAGPAAIGVFRVPSGTSRAALSLSVSLSPAGSGAAIGVCF